MEGEGSVRREVYRVAGEKEGRGEEGTGRGMERGTVGGFEEMKGREKKGEMTGRKQQQQQPYIT